MGVLRFERIVDDDKVAAASSQSADEVASREPLAVVVTSASLSLAELIFVAEKLLDRGWSASERGSHCRVCVPERQNS